MKNKKGILLMLVGLLFIAAAASLTIYNTFLQHDAGKRSERALKHVSEIILQNESSVPSSSELINYSTHFVCGMPVAEVDGLGYIGILEIPVLDLTLPVLDGWSYPNLKIAPCRYSGSVCTDDLVIAAHNYSSHFGGIGRLSVGQTATFTDINGNVCYYAVAGIETLQPNEKQKMTSGEWDLTLFTCTIGGQARVTVRLERIQPQSE